MVVFPDVQGRVNVSRLDRFEYKINRIYDPDDILGNVHSSRYNPLNSKPKKPLINQNPLQLKKLSPHHNCPQKRQQKIVKKTYMK